MSGPSAFKASLLLKMVAKSSRNQSLLDKFCRWLVNREVERSPEEDFMRDEIVDNDLGFDPDELSAYQSGRLET
ncbi:MAG: hypothetical protein ABJN35_14815 [Erythrobacter sp.]